MDNFRPNEQNNIRDIRDNFKSIQASKFMDSRSDNGLRDESRNQEHQNREIRDNFKNIDQLIDSMQNNR